MCSTYVSYQLFCSNSTHCIVYNMRLLFSYSCGSGAMEITGAAMVYKSCSVKFGRGNCKVLVVFMVSGKSSASCQCLCIQAISPALKGV